MATTPPPAPLRRVKLFPTPMDIARSYVVVLSDSLLPPHNPYDSRLYNFTNGTILPIDPLEWSSIIKGFQRQTLPPYLLNELNKDPQLESSLWNSYTTTCEQSIQYTTTDELSLWFMIGEIYTTSCGVRSTRELFKPEVTLEMFCKCTACGQLFNQAANKMEMLSLKGNMLVSVASKLSYIIANPFLQGHQGFDLLQHAFKYVVSARLNSPKPLFTTSTLRLRAFQIAQQYNNLNPATPINANSLQIAMLRVTQPRLPPHAGFLALIPYPSRVPGSLHMAIEDQDLGMIITAWDQYASDNPNLRLRTMRHYYDTWKREYTEIGSNAELRTYAEQHVNAKRINVLQEGAHKMISDRAFAQTAEAQKNARENVTGRIEAVQRPVAQGENKGTENQMKDQNMVKRIKAAKEPKATKGSDAAKNTEVDGVASRTRSKITKISGSP